MSSSHCSSLITNWSLMSDGSGDYTGTSASTTFICFNSASVFYVNGAKIGHFNPNTDYINEITSPLGGDVSEIANTLDKVWVYTGGTDLVEFDLQLSPILFNGLGVDFPSVTFNRLLTSSGVTAFDGLTALDNSTLIGGSGSTVYLHTITGSGFTSLSLFVLPESRLINDISFNVFKNTFVIACMKSDKTLNYISEFTTGGTLVNDFSFDNTTYLEVLSAVEYSGRTLFMAWDTVGPNTFEVEVDITNSGFTSGFDFGNDSYSGFSQSPGSMKSFFNFSAGSYCLSTLYASTSQFDGNFYSAGTYNGKTFYAGDGVGGGVLFYNIGLTSWCLSTSLGGNCVFFGGNSCQSEEPNLSEEFFNNTICPTPTPSPSNNCSVLDVAAFFDCDIPAPTPSITPTQTVTPTSGYTAPTPTPTMTMSPTPSGNVCQNVNFCFGVVNVSPTPTQTMTMTPSSAAGRNTPADGLVVFTIINGEVVCPPAQVG